MKPEFRLVRQMIYALKRIYPQRIELCRTSQNSTDYTTGMMDDLLTKVIIRRAILLPAKGLRDFSYDLSFIAANKNFTYGGHYDRRFRMVLIDRRDLRRADPNFPVDLNMHLVFDQKRWEVKQLGEYEEQEVLALVIERTEGSFLMNQEIESLDAEITLDGSVEGEPE